MERCAWAAAIALAFATTAAADGKISGTLDCDKAEPSYAIPVPDAQGQVFVIEQRKCTWTKRWIIAGEENTDNVQVSFVEVSATGVAVTTLCETIYSAGDHTYVRDVATAGHPSKWTFVSGTGKLQGIKGQGTSTCKMKSDEPGAGYVCNVTGSYKLPPTKKA